MPFDFQLSLKGERLELRPLRAEDFDPPYAVASDPLIWEQHPAKDRYKEDVFREFFREALQAGGGVGRYRRQRWARDRLIPISRIRRGS